MNCFLQIVFQSGDFYNEGNSFWTDFFINVFGALIGTLTALVIFLLTVKHDRKKEKERENNTIGQRLHYFSSMVDSINETVKKQSNHLKEFFENQRKDTLNIPLVTLLPDNDLKRFSELQNHEDYYHAYLSRFGYDSVIVKEYRNFYSLIDFLKTQNNQFQDMLMKSMQFDYERKVRYKNIVEKAMDDTALLFNSAKQEQRITDFEIFLNETLLNFYKGDVDFSDLNHFQSKFVDPIKIEIVKKYRENDIAIQLAGELKKATYIFTEIKLSNEEIANDFERIYKNYNDACDKLNKLTLKLRDKFK
jgi:hypothetical protein